MVGVAPILTEAGRGMLTRGILGEHILFTAFQLGSGSAAATPITALAAPKLRVPLTAREEPEDGYFRLTGTFSNADVETAFTWREMGILARAETQQVFTASGSKTFTLTEKPDMVYSVLVNGAPATISGYAAASGVVTLASAPASGASVQVHYPASEEQLYAYCTSDMTEDILPMGGSVAVEQSISVAVAIGAAENVIAQLTAETQYASKDELNAHTGRKDNPHGVTKEQLGLGNVVNAAPQDMVPGMSTFAGLVPPQGTDTLMDMNGKLYAQYHTLYNHLQASNPHGITLTALGIVYSETEPPVIEGGIWLKPVE